MFVKIMNQRTPDDVVEMFRLSLEGGKVVSNIPSPAAVDMIQNFKVYSNGKMISASDNPYGWLAALEGNMSGSSRVWAVTVN